MPTFIKNLRRGTVLETKTERYIYLGYYKGTPRSFNNVPNEGYLYLYLSNTNIKIHSELRGHIVLANEYGFDGFARYTKNPKQFELLIAHVDISCIYGYIQNIYGLQYIGETKSKIGVENQKQIVSTSRQNNTINKTYMKEDKGWVLLDINTNEYFQGLNKFGRELRKAEIYHNERYIQYIKEKYLERRFKVLQVTMSVRDF